MPLLIHSGTAAIDLNANFTQRQDISDVLLAALSNDNTLLGATTIGEEFAAPSLNWLEDALNQFKVTGDTAASMSSTVSTIAFSQSDAAAMDVGYTLELDTQVGATSQEQMQVITLTGTTATVTRAYAGTAQTYPQNSVFRVVNSPTYPNSDLGKDMSRARISKTNFINRWEANVNIDSEQILRSHQGYVPGVVDELGYQFQQRRVELLRRIQQAFLYSIPPASGSPTNDYQQMYGLVRMLDGTFNGTTQVVNTAATLSDSTINTLVLNIFRQGGFSNVIAQGPNLTQKIGQLYTDRIRLDQTDRTRGFFAQEFIPTMANPHRLLNDAYINDNLGFALLLVLDMNRIRLRPFVGQLLYTIEAESFRDGDAVRLLSKASLEARNTGTDVGQAHWLQKQLSF